MIQQAISNGKQAKFPGGRAAKLMENGVTLWTSFKSRLQERNPVNDSGYCIYRLLYYILNIKICLNNTQVLQSVPRSKQTPSLL